MLKKLVCKLCHVCSNDCKQVEEKIKCENYKRGFNRFEYQEMIKEQQLDIKKLCNKNGLKLNYLYKMLNGEMDFIYKYRYFLNEQIFEKDEYLPYLDEGVVN